MVEKAKNWLKIDHLAKENFDALAKWLQRNNP